MDFSNIAETIQTLGVIGVLIVNLWAFITGNLWPKAMVEKVLEEQRKIYEQSSEKLATEVCDKISDGVSNGMEQGIARGYLKINGSAGENVR